jgi:transcriptional regulator with XRE-family HTH domain
MSAGLSPSYVNKLESGEVQPSLRSFASICRVLEMTNQEILFILKHEASNEASEETR